MAIVRVSLVAYQWCKMLLLHLKKKTGTSKPEHISPALALFHFTGFLVHFRIHFIILPLVFKSLNNFPPSYLSELLHPYIPSHSLVSVKQLLLTVPKANLEVTKLLLWEYQNWTTLCLSAWQLLLFFKSCLKTHFTPWLSTQCEMPTLTS